MPGDQIQTDSIFLSYRNLESEFALRLAADLKNVGVHIWMDRLDGIMTGDDWRAAIEHAVANCPAMIAVLSPAYVSSDYCRRELARADDLKRPILPVLMEAVPKTAWPLEVQRNQYEDFTGWRDEAVYQSRLDALVRRLRQEVGAHVGSPPDAEARYLISLIATMESKRGVIQYVELAAETEATAERRPEPAAEDEWGFVWLLRDPANLPAHPGDDPQCAAATSRERLVSIAAAAERFARFVIIGHPGAGKTTAMRRLIRDLAVRRLKNPHGAPLPVWIDLPAWKDEPTPLHLVKSRWVFPGDPAASLRAGDIHLFLDGLNEMGDRAARHAEQLREWLKSPDGPARAVFTCRAGDYASKTLRLDDLPTVLIQDLDEPQVRRFAVNYLQMKATEFLDRVVPGPLAGNEGTGLLPLAQNPYMLSALIFLFEHTADGALPRNAGTLVRGLARALWEREGKRHTRGWVPFEKAEAVFARLAFAMIDEDRATAVDEDYVLRLLGSNDLLVAGFSATYFNRDGDSIRFYHQLLQEYFAAVGLRAAGLESRLEGASYQFLPGGVRPDPFEWPARVASKWDAVIIALCGIVENPDEVIVSVLKTDPSLAAGCAASGVLLDPETRRKTIDRLLTVFRNGPERISVAMVHAFRLLDDPAAAPGLVAIVREELARDNSSQQLELAVMALGGCPGPVAVGGLLEVLSGAAKQIRIRAIRSLGHVGDQTVVPDLFGVLWDHEEVYLYFSTKSSPHREAVDALVRIGQRLPQAVVPMMVEGLRSPNADVRYASASVLAAASDRSAVRGLLDALVYDVDSRVTYTAGTALSRVRDAGAVLQLLDGLRHSDARARAASAQGLGSIGDPSAVQGLLDALHYDVDSHVRAESAKALGAIRDSREVEGLLNGLRDSDPNVRRESAKALGAIGDRAALSRLLDAMTYDVDADVRTESAVALGAIGDGAAVTGLLEAIRRDSHLNVRTAGANALLQFNDSRIVPTLLDGLRDPDEWKRAEAARALGDRTDAAPAAPPLIAVLADESDRVRYFAREALSRIGRPAVRGLLDVLESRSVIVRRETVRVLQAIGDREAIPALERRRDDEDDEVRWRVKEAIASLLSGNRVIIG
jgi:HEAT repeat protein